jgi:hypothetical protein
VREGILNVGFCPDLSGLNERKDGFGASSFAKATERQVRGNDRWEKRFLPLVEMTEGKRNDGCERLR